MKTPITKISAALLLATSNFGFAQEKPGGFQREVWTDVWGGGLWHLRNSPRYHQKPQLVEFMEGAVAPSNVGEKYGQRLRGYITPKVSGEYVFWIASDDNAELSISPDDSKFNKRPIALICGLGHGHGMDYVKPLDFEGFETQKSRKIQLEAGKRYFIEALHKEGMGDDHLALAWTPPGKDREIIPSEVLTSYDGEAADLDKDGLPDSWEENHRFSQADNGEAQLENGPLGDPDGDGWLNWEECQNGSDPRKPEVQQGALTQEIWYGVSGESMADLHANWRFFFPGDRRALVRGFDIKEEIGADQFGMRLRGYLTPTVSGAYRFAIKGDDNCEFWISDSESKFEVQRLAWIESGGEKRGFTERDEWEKFDSQLSKEIRMEAGKSYFVEVLQKEGWYDGHVDVCWIPPGSESREVIPPSAIRSYLPTLEDSDDDDLPTDWEKRYGLDPDNNGYDDGPLGDPDRDWIPNWIEYRSGSNPVVAEVKEGAYTDEIWWDLKGNRLEDLTQSDKWFEGAHWTSLESGVFGTQARGDNFGLRLRARLKPPVSGSYRFWIAGDNHCALWISDDDQKFKKRKIAWIEGPGTGVAGDYVEPRSWDELSSQRSKEITLEEGREYFIEVILKEGSGGDHVEVAWQVPGQDRESLSSEYLNSYLVGESDSDDDYLPDTWERRYGLNPKDNGLEDRAREGEAGDFDGDRLSNHEEYLAGTDPGKADTDGDGINDYDELKVYGSSPTVKDASPPRLVREFDLTQGQNVTDWMPNENGSMTSLTRRGKMDFEFELDEAGIYLVDFQGETVGYAEYVPEIAVACLVNNLKVGDTRVAREGSRTRWLTQWLPAGRHRVTIQNNNVHKDALLKVNELRLFRQDGEDRDGNGIPDWLEKYYQATNSIHVSTTESYVSPCCVEGSARFFELCTLNGGEIPISRSVGQQWYANVPLNENGTTPIEISFDQGSQKITPSLTWLETDLFALGGESLRVRVGDSLKIGAGDFGDTGLEISLNGGIQGTAFSGAPLIIAFSSPGTHLLEGVAEGGEAIQVGISVYDASFGNTFSVAGGYPRIWEVPSIPQELALEYDQELLAEEVFLGEGQPRCFSVNAPADSVLQSTVLTRVSPGGPIAASTQVNVFDMINLSDSQDQFVIKTLSDGTKIIESTFGILGTIPEDLSVSLEFFVTDCLFENGDTTLELIASDFDESGQARVRMYKGSGHEGGLWTCHYVRPFANDRFLPADQ